MGQGFRQSWLHLGHPWLWPIEKLELYRPLNLLVFVNHFPS
jgi:hypothetical protein